MKKYIQVSVNREKPDGDWYGQIITDGVGGETKKMGHFVNGEWADDTFGRCVTYWFKEELIKTNEI